MHIGAVIRSVGERTESLCVESVSKSLQVENIVVVRNLYPFVKTLKRCYDIALEKKFDWFMAVDADMVLVPGWKSKVKQAIRYHGRNKKVWTISYDLYDNITPKTINGVHCINVRYCEHLLVEVNRVKNFIRPEQDIRNGLTKIGLKVVQLGHIKLGYHGYEQWRKDLFNRFVVKACRDQGYVRKQRLFQGTLTKEQKIAKLGWDYGLKHRKTLKGVFDHSKKLSLNLVEVKELPPIACSLDGFYLKCKR